MHAFFFKWIKEEKNHVLISQIYAIVFLTIIFAALVTAWAVGVLTGVSLQKQEAHGQ